MAIRLRYNLQNTTIHNLLVADALAKAHITVFRFTVSFEHVVQFEIFQSSSLPSSEKNLNMYRFFLLLYKGNEIIWL